MLNKFNQTKPNMCGMGNSVKFCVSDLQKYKKVKRVRSELRSCVKEEMDLGLLSCC